MMPDSRKRADRHTAHGGPRRTARAPVHRPGPTRSLASDAAMRHDRCPEVDGRHGVTSMEQHSGDAPVQAPSDYVSEASFDELGLSEPIRRAIAERGYTKPTPVQSSSYRPIREGKDVIVRSKTGTGKTAAFGIPILERIPAGRRKASALVMCPTRELALQVAEELTALAKHKDLSVVTVYGGASIGA